MKLKIPEIKRIRYFLEWTAARVLLGLFRILPRKWGIRLAFVLAYPFWEIMKPLRKSAEVNIRIAYPDWDERKVRRLSDQVCLHFSRLVVDFANMDRFTPRALADGSAPFPVRFRNLELLQDAIAEGHGVILVTGHLGLWELTGDLISKIEPLTVIGAHMENPWLDAYIHRQRQSGGMVSLDRERAIFPLLKILKKGGMVGALVDQSAGRNAGFVKFFGRYASTYDILPRLSLRTGAPMILVAGYYDDMTGEYVVWLRQRIQLQHSSGDLETDVMRLMQLQSHALENAIREHPEQWTWMYRRFKHKPTVGSRVLDDDGEIKAFTFDEGLIPLEEFEARQRNKRDANDLKKKSG